MYDKLHLINGKNQVVYRSFCKFRFAPLAGRRGGGMMP